jgi:alkylhydroperoxidase family enzyme
MANVKTVPVDTATGKVRAHYEKMRQTARGFGADEYQHLIQTWSLQLDVAEAWLALSVIAKQNAGLDDRRYELILCRIVYLYRCRYVTVNHAKILAGVGGYSHDQVKRYIQDWSNSDLSVADKGLLAFAEKVARRSQEVTRADVQALLQHGFDEAQAVALIFLIGWLVTDAIVPNALGPETDIFSRDFADIADW